MIKETIIAYALLCDNSFTGTSENVAEKVNMYIKNGYQPFEAPQLRGHSGTICQAVVKYQE